MVIVGFLGESTISEESSGIQNTCKCEVDMESSHEMLL